MKGFAVSENRLIKAKKIESVLNKYLNKRIAGLKILDIGAGDGAISSYFTSLGNNVTCVDIEDQRTGKEAKFVQVNSAKLPMQSNQFDVVISNHVIEHIREQKLHLKEIKRVLKKDGVCYLATPNRNFPIEPHYKIPFIHYLPRNLFFTILKTSGLYKEDLFLLSYFKMKSMFNEFAVKEYTPEILKNPENNNISWKLISKLPMGIIKSMVFISPTNIFILKK